MSPNPDIPALPESEVTSDDVMFDDLADRAGAALRRPAPDDGVRLIAHRRRHQQALKATIVGGVAVVALLGGLAFVVSDDDSDGVPPVDSLPPTLPSTTAPVQSIDSAADQAAAEAALFILSDFGNGWTEVARTVDLVTDQGVAECMGLEPGSTGFGGASAASGEFTFPSGKWVSESVDFAPSVEAASEHMALLAGPDFVGCVQPIFERATEDEVNGDGATLEGFTVVHQQNVAPVGDQMVGFRVTATVVAPGFRDVYYVDEIVIQSGRVVADLHFESQNAPFPTALVNEYIALAVSRLPAA